jgi:hypothetical protein
MFFRSGLVFRFFDHKNASALIGSRPISLRASWIVCVRATPTGSFILALAIVALPLPPGFIDFLGRGFAAGQTSEEVENLR